MFRLLFIGQRLIFPLITCKSRQMSLLRVLLMNLCPEWCYTPYEKRSPKEDYARMRVPRNPHFPITSFHTLLPTHTLILAPFQKSTLTFVLFFRFCWLASRSIPSFRENSSAFCGQKHKTATQFWRWTVQWRTLTFCIFVSLAFFVRFSERTGERGERLGIARTRCLLTVFIFVFSSHIFISFQP